MVYIVLLIILLVFAVNVLMRIYIGLLLGKKREIVLKRKSDLKISASGGGIKKKLLNYIDGFVAIAFLCVGKFPSNRIRKFFYIYVFCMQLSKNTVIYHGLDARSPWNIKIGNSIIGPHVSLDGRCGLEIGDNVDISNNASIWTMQHDYNDEYFGVSRVSAPVIVKDYAWISSGSVVLPGTTIEEGSVVAARAVITENTEPYGVYAGIPAQKIAERTRNLSYQIGEHWHFY